MKPDEAHIETDKKIAELEKRMRREYRQAAKEVEEKLADYFRRFEKKDEIKRAQLAAGEISKADYDGWRTGQMLAGERWKEMRDTLAADLNAVNMNARRIVNGERAEVYAENHNYATYEIEKAAKVDTSYTLYDRSTVERIAAKQPDILPAPGKHMKGKLARGEAVRWQAGQIQSVTLQSILQGESIPNMAKRIGRTLGEKNYGTAVRYARTAMTGAQSAGRQDSYKRAEDMGINLKRRWVATLDMRTRHEHRMLDMQVRGVDEPFDAEGAEIMFPGDPNAPAHLIWNCRCRTIAEVEGLEHNWDRRSTDALEGMTYEEWKKAHGKSQPITAQTEKGEAAKRAAVNEYRNAKTRKEFNFTPAKTIEEAEEYARQLVDPKRFGALGVSYKGVGLDVANEVNRTLGRFYEMFDVEKFGGILAPAGNTKYGKQIQSATAAYSDVRRTFFLNRTRFKTLKTAQDAFAKEAAAVNDVLKHPERYNMSKASAQFRRIIENSKVSGRGTIPQTVEEALHHELGHSLESALKNSGAWEEILANMPKFNQKLSGYACENASEYIAEAFCSYMKGEDIIDPVLARAFNGLRRK